MPDVGTSAMERVPNMPETEASETYPELRERLHDCMTFDVPAGIYRGDFQDGRSRFEQLPQEVILTIKGFLSFKSRCCLALASKFLGNIILEPPLDDTDQLQVYNHSFKEIFVHLPPSLPSRHNPPALPTQKATHVCGEYKDLLRTLAKDWNSAAIRLCVFCIAWRPLGQQYWEDRARVKPLKSYKIAAWIKGGDCRCPECFDDCRLLSGDIDGVSGMVSGVLTG